MSNNKTITICSTSFHEYDRRLQRISLTLYSAGYKIQWISRSYQTTTKTGEYANHIIINTLFQSGILFYLEYNIRLFWKLLRSNSILINAVDLDTVPGSFLASIVLRKTIVFDAHEIFYEVPELIGRPIKKGIWKIIAQLFLPHIKHNYTVNESLAKHYSKYKNSYGVIRNVPNANHSNTEKQNNKELVYLGVLNKGRGLELAIEAMRLLPEYKLTIIGDGDISESLQEQAKDLDQVRFLGFIEPKELNSVMKKAAIGLNMLQAESLNYKLSLANKFFDYMHAGLPSINMNFPEYRTILNNHKTGLLIEEYSVSALVTALKTLENPSIYRELNTNCSTFKDNYSWENEQFKLISIYAEAINS